MPLGGIAGTELRWFPWSCQLFVLPKRRWPLSWLALEGAQERKHAMTSSLPLFGPDRLDSDVVTEVLHGALGR